MNFQQALAALIKELNYLYLVATPPYDQTIKKIIDALNDLSLAALKQTLDNNSQQFQTATASLTQATQAAEDAVTDLTKVSNAISQAVQVVKVVDKLLQYAGTFV